MLVYIKSFCPREVADDRSMIFRASNFLKNSKIDGNNKLLPGLIKWPNIFRQKGVNGVKKQQQKPFLARKTPALTSLNREKSGINGVELQKSGVSGD